jgi:hypothetical protein
MMYKRLTNREEWSVWEGDEIEGAITGKTLFIKDWCEFARSRMYSYKHIYILREAVECQKVALDILKESLVECLAVGNKVTVEIPIHGKTKFYADIIKLAVIYSNLRIQICLDMPKFKKGNEPNIEIRLDHEEAFDVTCYGIKYINKPLLEDYNKDKRLL